MRYAQCGIFILPRKRTNVSTMGQKGGAALGQKKGGKPERDRRFLDQHDAR